MISKSNRDFSPSPARKQEDDRMSLQERRASLDRRRDEDGASMASSADATLDIASP
jgi:hypothetical protein